MATEHASSEATALGEAAASGVSHTVEGIAHAAEHAIEAAEERAERAEEAAQQLADSVRHTEHSRRIDGIEEKVDKWHGDHVQHLETLREENRQLREEMGQMRTHLQELKPPVLAIVEKEPASILPHSEAKPEAMEVPLAEKLSEQNASIPVARKRVTFL